MRDRSSDAQVDILVVEDTHSDAALLVHELRRHNLAHRIQVIGNGEEALDFIFCRGQYQGRSFLRPPKMILLDLQLPQLDGLAVLKAIKGDARTRATPVVVMTSSTEPYELTESYQLGVNAVIRKPVSFKDFRQMIERIATFWIGVNRLPLSGIAAHEAISE